MITSTVSSTSTEEEGSAIEHCPSPAGTEENYRHVSLRLQGRWEDIMSALDHWRIEFDRRSEQAISQGDDECVVYGTLNTQL